MSDETCTFRVYDDDDVVPFDEYNDGRFTKDVPYVEYTIPLLLVEYIELYGV